MRGVCGDADAAGAHKVREGLVHGRHAARAEDRGERALGGQRVGQLAPRLRVPRQRRHQHLAHALVALDRQPPVQLAHKRHAVPVPRIKPRQRPSQQKRAQRALLVPFYFLPFLLLLLLLLVVVDEGLLLLLLLLVWAWRRLGDDVSLLVDESDAKSVLGMS